MHYTLKYSSSRSEVWRWYWKAWKARLWRNDVFLAFFFCIGFAGIGLKSTDAVVWGKYFIAALSLIILFKSAVPQLLFKSQERILNIGPDGWETQIGKKTGSRRWSEIASITEDAGTVVIANKNGNALIVPARAFSGNEDKQQVIKDITAWHTAYASTDSQSDLPDR